MQKHTLSEAPAPLPRTYWVVDGLLLAGAYPGQPTPKAHRERLGGLYDAGMRTFISLMEESETNDLGHPFTPYVEDLREIALKRKERVTCVRYAIVDQSVTTQSHMVEIVDTIDASIDDQRPVFVHCYGGIGRTGTVVSCWLLRHGYATTANVFEVLQRLRKADLERSFRRAPENEIQREFVMKWANSISKRA